METDINLSKIGRNSLVLLRILIGWHFLYEGVLKLYNPAWTSKAYLSSAELLRPLFQWLSSDAMIHLVDNLNIFSLMVVGLSLLLGLFERIGSVFGICLLLIYYIAHPALPGASQVGTEGSYWIINKNLIEATALFVLYHIPTGSYFGLNLLRKILLAPQTK
ncbi:MAG: DoxX subfamily [Flammeovirgaceae bacterium]|nr:DoxX subfamily [Flammeovirgaceae bacterium]|tara:strand:- start:590 stop:1075 length:486 start_codon:yes stop_codon:yes gene_type:complete